MLQLRRGITMVVEYTGQAETRTVPRVVPVSRGKIVVGWLTTTDHKTIGYLYLITSFIMFCVAGVMALVIRTELFEPGMQVLQTKEQYNQLFTGHGTIMMFLFATPLFAGFANVIMPLQIGAPDVAFPRLNALAYWFFLFGALIVVGGFVTPQGSADYGWTAYPPLSQATFSPGVGGDLWVMGLALAGFGTILGSVNFITTIICMRAPGMTMWRMPIFTWNTLVTSILVLMAFPVLAAALFGLAADTGGSAPTSTTPRTGAPSSGSTCSGSSATPRSTSSRCRSSASCPKSSPSSAANRSSATRASSSRPSRSPPTP
jgi:cytochrome c oxidase subunit I